MSQVLYLNIKVIPKAPKTELVEIMKDPDGEEVWKIKVAAVPEKGKANHELCCFLARHFNVPRSAVSVSLGARSQRKVVKIYLEKSIPKARKYHSREERSQEHKQKGSLVRYLK